MLVDHLMKLLSSHSATPHLYSVIFLDLDHFKLLNDSLGHGVGDQLLLECSQRISDCLRGHDLLARLEGDEFVIVLAGDKSEYSDCQKYSEEVSQKILQVMSEPFLLKSSLYHVSASRGIVLNEGQETNINSLLKHADTAMYHSKSKGRNRFSIFRDEMQSQADYRLVMEKDLRKAIENHEIYLVYQPQINSKNHCSSFEALCRWQHPEKGAISPDKFIGIAEESKLIIPLGQLILEKVCEQIIEINKNATQLSHISINISPVQFSQHDFIDRVLDTVNKYQVSPASLMFEITEGVIIEDPEQVINKLLHLKSQGFRISVDDFGTGYSSLMYLKRLPISELKVDRSFISGLGKDDSDTVITETIIAMAENLGFRVLAEGVETSKQREILVNLGCHLFQGFLFSKPILENQLIEYISHQVCIELEMTNSHAKS